MDFASDASTGARIFRVAEAPAVILPSMTPIPTSPPSAPLRIVPVADAAALGEFIAVPRGIFKSDPVMDRAADP